MKITNCTGTNYADYSQMQNTNSVNQDSRLKSIQNQIENVQQQLQSLADNEEMPMEEKMNRRKELQQQLQDLNRQMLQRKMEIQQERREKLVAKAKSQEPAQGNTDKPECSVMGTASMQGIISADASMKQVKMIRSGKTSMKGQADVLECEIKLDKGRGGSTEKKEAELAELKGRTNDASADLMNQVSAINTTLEKSREENKTEDAEKKEGTEAIKRGDNLAGTDGKTLSEQVKIAANSETWQTEAQGNPDYLQKSGNQAKGQYVNIKL